MDSDSDSSEEKDAIIIGSPVRQGGPRGARSSDAESDDSDDDGRSPQTQLSPAQPLSPRSPRDRAASPSNAKSPEKPPQTRRVTSFPDLQSIMNFSTPSKEKKHPGSPTPDPEEDDPKEPRHMALSRFRPVAAQVASGMYVVKRQTKFLSNLVKCSTMFAEEVNKCAKLESARKSKYERDGMEGMTKLAQTMQASSLEIARAHSEFAKTLSEQIIAPLREWHIKSLYKHKTLVTAEKALATNLAATHSNLLKQRVECVKAWQLLVEARKALLEFDNPNAAGDVRGPAAAKGPTFALIDTSNLEGSGMIMGRSAAMTMRGGNRPDPDSLDVPKLPIGSLGRSPSNLAQGGAPWGADAKAPKKLIIRLVVPDEHGGGFITEAVDPDVAVPTFVELVCDKLRAKRSRMGQNTAALKAESFRIVPYFEGKVQFDLVDVSRVESSVGEYVEEVGAVRTKKNRAGLFSKQDPEKSRAKLVQKIEGRREKTHKAFAKYEELLDAANRLSTDYSQKSLPRFLSHMERIEQSRHALLQQHARNLADLMHTSLIAPLTLIPQQLEIAVSNTDSTKDIQDWVSRTNDLPIDEPMLEPTVFKYNLPVLPRQMSVDGGWEAFADTGPKLNKTNVNASSLVVVVDNCVRSLVDAPSADAQTMGLKEGDVVWVLPEDLELVKTALKADAKAEPPMIRGRLITDAGSLERVKKFRPQNIVMETVSKMSLKQLVQIPMGLVWLTKQLALEYSVENINFWVEARDFHEQARAWIDERVQDYVSSKIKKAETKGKKSRRGEDEAEEKSRPGFLKGIINDPVLVGLARTIVDEYVCVQAPQQVNLSASHQRTILRALASGGITADLFTAAQTEVFKLMERDSYTRFASGPMFAQLMEQLGYKVDHMVKGDGVFSDDEDDR